jgi:hypothetical protein
MNTCLLTEARVHHVTAGLFYLYIPDKGVYYCNSAGNWRKSIMYMDLSTENTESLQDTDMYTQSLVYEFLLSDQ